MVKINKIKTNKMWIINERKSWYFEKIKNIEKFLSKLATRQCENIQIKKIRDEKEDATADHKESHKFIGPCFKNLYFIEF